jgi:hypothetical protein
VETIKIKNLNPFGILFWKASFKQAKLGWLIRKVTGDKVNHCGWFLGTKMGFRLAYESTEDGPSVNEFSKKYPPSYVGYLKVPLTLEEKIRLVVELNKLKHRKYDWRHLFGYYIGLDNPQRILCSELVTEPLKAIGKDLERKNEKPEGIFESPDLVIYRINPQY